jgi:AcrR family transcriptional regulator
MEATYYTRCENGCTGLSLRKVAEEAEKSRGLVHYHYDSKSDLLASLLDYLVERFEVRFGEPEGASALDDGALRERLADVRGFGD